MNSTRNRATLGHRNDRSGNGQLSGSKRKELLADEDAPVAETAHNAQKATDSVFSKFVVHANRYDYPRLGKVPAAVFYSKIADMRVREKNGEAILDVYYDIEDCYGQLFYIVQSYWADSQHYQRFAAALAAAGVPDDATADAGIGVTEMIRIDYVSKKTNVGSIVERKPYTVPPAADDDTEFDDFCLDDEE